MRACVRAPSVVSKSKTGLTSAAAARWRSCGGLAVDKRKFAVARTDRSATPPTLRLVTVGSPAYSPTSAPVPRAKTKSASNRRARSDFSAATSRRVVLGSLT